VGLRLEGLNDREFAKEMATGHNRSILVLIIAGGNGTDFAFHLRKGQELAGDVGVHGGRSDLLDKPWSCCRSARNSRSTRGWNTRR